MTAKAATVGLAWDASSDPTVTGYKIYTGTALLVYTNSINVGNTTNCTISNLVVGVTYHFAATAYNAFGLESDYSAEATYAVPVGVAPVITAQPTNLTVSAGSSALFSVSATGTLPFTYQWRFKGTNIVAATNLSFSLSAVTTNNAGSYVVLVGNTAGSVTSNPAILTVIPVVAPATDLRGVVF